MIGEIEKVKEMVFTLIPDLSKPELQGMIDIYTNEIGRRITHYCNIDKVPAALNYVWASMVIDLIRLEQPNLEAIANTYRIGGLIRVGDTNIDNFKRGGVVDISNTSKSVIDSVVANYKLDLHRYRRLRW